MLISMARYSLFVLKVPLKTPTTNPLFIFYITETLLKYVLYLFTYFKI